MRLVPVSIVFLIFLPQTGLAQESADGCGVLTCRVLETTYEDGKKSVKNIRTDWEVCEAASTARNLKTGKTFQVSIGSDYIEFLEPPTTGKAPQLRPVSHLFTGCKGRNQ